VENLLYFSSSSSSNGVTTITVTFEVGTDTDKATFNVNNRVQLATPRLPDEVRRNGVVVAKQSTNFLMVAALNSPKSTYDELFLSNYATQNVVDDIKRVAGVGGVAGEVDEHPGGVGVHHVERCHDGTGLADAGGEPADGRGVGSHGDSDRDRESCAGQAGGHHGVPSVVGGCVPAFLRFGNTWYQSGGY
jgi:hypothetical protein